MHTKPQTIGLKRSFGFGDRLGLATPGHVDAVRGTSFLPVFAQQSVRELSRTGREPVDVLRCARTGIEAAEWDGIWGADADHLQSRDDVVRMAGAGFSLFTIDPSAYVNNEADSLAGAALEKAYTETCAELTIPVERAFDLYHGRRYEVADGVWIAMDSRELLMRAFVKYARALGHTRQMDTWIAEACGQRPVEIEMSVDETLTPTSPLEHLLVGLELKRTGVHIVSLAPRFPGAFEKGVDYKGDLASFDKEYRTHASIARFCGPYKLSIHSGSDKFSIYPTVGRVSGDLLHVKTAGTSYLEALRAVCRADRRLFREIVAYCRSRYDSDKATYHVSADLHDLQSNPVDADLEPQYLDAAAGRQVLHVTFGSVLTQGISSNGASFKTLILDLLTVHADLYRELLRKHLGRHLRLLDS